jgi:mono/diheme cytochrome c family protein
MRVATACVVGVWLFAALPARAFGPATNYAIHCQGCHLEDGSGMPGKVPALDGALARLAATPDGRAYLARVPGVANAPLGDAELAALLDWTLRRFAGSAATGAAPFTAAEIGALRAAPPLTDVAGARARVLGP